MSHNSSRRSFIATGLLVSGCSALPIPSGLKTDPWQHAADIRSSVHEPSIPDRAFSVLDYGAVGDGEYLNTDAFADAIDACAAAGGGRVVVPEGHYHTGAIHLRSNIELHLKAGSIILFSTDPADYPLVRTLRLPAKACCTDKLQMKTGGPGVVHPGLVGQRACPGSKKIGISYSPRQKQACLWDRESTVRGIIFDQV